MKLLSWGANNYGQLGLGHVSEQYNYPTEVVQNQFLTEEVKVILGGGGHSLALDCSGQVYGCGLNSSYQLGFEGSEREVNFKKLECLTEHRISQIACGWDTSFAITEDGYLLGWGSNSHGQLGFQRNELKSTKNPSICVQSRVKQVSSGLRHTAVLLEDGKVLVSGQGRKGQLGILKDSAPVTQLDHFEYVPMIDNATRIACGQNHTVVLNDNGMLLAWGDNKHGQLGCSAEHTPYSHKPLAVTCELEPVASLNIGWTHTLLLTDGGTVLSFGRNTYGQLGSRRSETSESTLQTLPDLPQDVKQIVTGSEHSIALSASGEVWSWGWNEHGNCGLGHSNNVFTPSKVPLGSRSVLIGTGSAHCFAVVE